MNRTTSRPGPGGSRGRRGGARGACARARPDSCRSSPPRGDGAPRTATRRARRSRRTSPCERGGGEGRRGARRQLFTVADVRLPPTATRGRGRRSARSRARARRAPQAGRHLEQGRALGGVEALEEGFPRGLEPPGGGGLLLRRAPLHVALEALRARPERGHLSRASGRLRGQSAMPRKRRRARRGRGNGVASPFVRARPARRAGLWTPAGRHAGSGVHRSRIGPAPTGSVLSRWTII